MNKLTITLLLSVAVLTPGVASAQISSPEFEWGNLFDGSTTAGDQSQNIALSTDGGVYWHNMGGSTASAPTITYAGESLFDGALYDAGTSQNANLALLKTDTEGHLLWCLHSVTGDFSSNEGRVAATSDGGAVFTGRVRHTDGMTDVNFSLVDGTGKEHTYEWTADRRYYRIIVGRVDADGALQWVRFVDADTDPAPAASGSYAEFSADSNTTNGLAVDRDDNIYFSGNFRKNLHIPSGDSEVVLTPRNTETWSGDPQSNAGSMYLVKLDGQGDYVSHLQTSGSATYETIQRLVWMGNGLYFQGLVYGNGNSLTIGDTTVTPEGDFSPVLGKLDANLNVKWINMMKGEKVGGKYGFQNCNISLCEDTVWFVGQFNGMVSGADGTEYFTSTQGTLREGFLAKFRASTGEFQKGVSSKAAFTQNVLTGYYDAIQNPYAPGKVYVFGYGMNATVGVFLRPYDAVTLEADPESAWTLASQGGVPTCQSCAYDIDTREFFFTARGNKPFVCDGETVGSNTTWAILMASYLLPEADFPSVVEGVEGVSTSLGVSVGKGQLVLTSAAPAEVTVYDVAGRPAARVTVDGTATVALPAGLYIVAGHKVIIR